MKVMMSLKYPGGAVINKVKLFTNNKHRDNYVMLLFRKGIKVISEIEIKNQSYEHNTRKQINRRVYGA